MSLYAADGSINVTVVNGASLTGVQAPNGSYNVVVSDPDTLCGLYHSCGAFNVVTAPDGSFVGRIAANGAMYVTEDPDRKDGAVRVTVLSGSLGDEPVAAPTVSGVSISGDPRVGQTLTANSTIAGGTSTAGYEWFSNGVTISGAHLSTYVVQSAYLDTDVGVTVSATNITGTAHASAVPVHIGATLSGGGTDQVTSADVSWHITTTIAKGQIYYVITASNVSPTSAQIIAGQDENGAAAAVGAHVNANQLTTSVTNAANNTLSPTTTYYVYIAQRHRSVFTSNVATITFTTTS
jgi:hypothetical protein